MLFQDIKNKDKIYLYCGDLPHQRIEYTKLNFIGLSLSQSNYNHIKHDITNKFDLFDNSVDIIQSEDVMEHIEYDKLINIINEIYRVLKKGGLFRLSLPDYRCDILYNRSLKNTNGFSVLKYKRVCSTAGSFTNEVVKCSLSSSKNISYFFININVKKACPQLADRL